jgi:transposase
MDIREILRQLRAGESDRAISRSMKLDRATVKRYRAWAEREGLMTGALPTPEALEKRLKESLGSVAVPQNVSSVEPYRTQVVELRERGVNIKTVWRRLVERGFRGSMHAVYRFVWQLEGKSTAGLTVRVEREPGEEAQVDFGYAGYLLDEHGVARKAWAFVMTLSWSRHMYVEFVFDQRLETWLQVHVNAFAFFGGVVQRVVCDNLKAAIVRASWNGDMPEVQWAYRELAEHYQFLIGPCRPATPQHKGKVERGVGYVKGSFLAGRDMMTRREANRAARAWCLEEAGQRVHGTTRQQPLVRFEQTERATLRALPSAAYELAVWKQVKLHRDGYIVFENAYYSAPFRYVGQSLWVRGTRTDVKLYTSDYQAVASHSRVEAGQRQTQPDHVVPYKQPGLFWNAQTVQDKAAQIGSATLQTVQALLGTPVIDPLPTTRRLLKLAEQYTPERLEAACARALVYGDTTYTTVKGILKQNLEGLPIPTSSITPPATTFVRSPQELLGNLAEVQL